jgi:hypothetical protein
MVNAGRKARDLALLDALDAIKPEKFEDVVWRIVRDGRDPASRTSVRRAVGA